MQGKRKKACNYSQSFSQLTPQLQILILKNHRHSKRQRTELQHGYSKLWRIINLLDRCLASGAQDHSESCPIYLNVFKILLLNLSGFISLVLEKHRIGFCDPQVHVPWDLHCLFLLQCKFQSLESLFLWSRDLPH